MKELGSLSREDDAFGAFWANGVPFVSIERLLDVDHKTEEPFRMGLAMRMQGEIEKLRVGGPGQEFVQR